MSAAGVAAAILPTSPAAFPRLRQVVETLAPQVDLLFVEVAGPLDGAPALNDLAAVRLRGDALPNGLTALSEIEDSHVLLVADDALYPPDYAALLCAGLDAFGRRACLSVCAATPPPRPGWAGERLSVHPPDAACAHFALAALGCAGAFAFHQSALRLCAEDAPVGARLDLHLSRAARDAGAPIFSPPRPEAWLRGVSEAPLWPDRPMIDPADAAEAQRLDWSFAAFADPARRALAAFDAGAARDGAAGRVDPGLREALDLGGEPADWRQGVEAFTLRAARLDALLKETET